MIKATVVRSSLVAILTLFVAPTFALQKAVAKPAVTPPTKTEAQAEPFESGKENTKETTKETTDEQDVLQVEKELKVEKTDDIVPAVKTAPIKAVPVVDLSEYRSVKRKTETIVIQKNYMPKTERFQIFGGLSFLPTEVFYKTLGLQIRGSYHFSETWGVEMTGLFLGSSRSAELTDVENKQGVNVENLVSPKSYIGLDVYFNSIYGKAAFNERQIIPFEVYLSAGIGKMSTAISQNLDAFHLGVGQLFAMSRSNALRVDLSLLSYKSLTINGDSQLTNNLLLTVGYGHFMPEALYR